MAPTAWQMLMCIGGCKNGECDAEELLTRAFIDDPAEMPAEGSTVATLPHQVF